MANQIETLFPTSGSSAIVIQNYFFSRSQPTIGSNHSDNLFEELSSISMNILMKQKPFFVQQEDLIKLLEYNQKENRLVLPAYKSPSNVMYSCMKNEFEEKIIHFMAQTNAYIKMCSFDPSNLNVHQLYLQVIFQQIKSRLDHLYYEKAIDARQYALFMSINKTNFQFDHLYFLPDIRQREVPIQPIRISVSNPINSIAAYIYYLIAPFYYQQIAQSFTYSRGSQAIDALESYIEQGLFHRQTSLVTLKFPHICINFNHTIVLQILERFLNDHLPIRQRRNLSISTILSLIHLVLSNQYYLYNQNELYLQTKGGLFEQPLMILLVDICLFYWHQNLANSLDRKKEIFGRYLSFFYVKISSKIVFLCLFLMRLHLNSSLFSELSIKSF